MHPLSTSTAATCQDSLAFRAGRRPKLARPGADFFVGHIHPKRGLASRIARELQVSRAAVACWRHAGIPIERVPFLERLTGVDRSAIRPDFWPPVETVETVRTALGGLADLPLGQAVLARKQRETANG